MGRSEGSARPRARRSRQPWDRTEPRTPPATPAGRTDGARGGSAAERRRSAAETAERIGGARPGRRGQVRGVALRAWAWPGRGGPGTETRAGRGFCVGAWPGDEGRRRGGGGGGPSPSPALPGLFPASGARCRGRSCRRWGSSRAAHSWAGASVRAPVPRAPTRFLQSPTPSPAGKLPSEVPKGPRRWFRSGDCSPSPLPPGRTLGTPLGRPGRTGGLSGARNEREHEFPRRTDFSLFPGASPRLLPERRASQPSSPLELENRLGAEDARPLSPAFTGPGILDGILVP